MSDARFQFDEEAVIGTDHPIELIFYDKDDNGVLTPESLEDRNWTYLVKSSAGDADGDAIVTLTSVGLTIVIDSDQNATLNPTNVKNRATLWVPNASTSLMSVRHYVQILNSVEISSSRKFTKGLGQLTMVNEDPDGGH